ncbi:MAG: hypothetical protein HY875_13185 [Chloroflexi bacterium]|nr:hypothetical protein [Chloroflexota bacterium]
MTTLSDIRTKLRKDLHDTDAGAYRWTDSQLDRHIERALGEVSQAIPSEKSATIATTSGSRDISLASLTGLLGVDAVEFPTGDFPPAYVAFSQWGTALTLDVDTAPTGQNAKVFYTARHTLDGSGTTLGPQLEDVVATGAAAYAALELANYLIDKVNSAGDEVSERYGSWGRAWMMAYRELIRVQARRGSVRPRRLFVPA